MARGRTKAVWSSTIASATGIGAPDGDGLAGLAAAGVVATDFGFPRWRWLANGEMLQESMEVLGVDGNKVEKERV